MPLPRLDPALFATTELLAELARRFRVRYGRIEIAFHDGRPSPRVLVEHRVQRAVDGPDDGGKPTRTEGRQP